MAPNNVEQPPIQEPLAVLERHLIDAYLAGAGQNFHDLMTRDDEEARHLLAEASLYASDRLSEIESRAHWLQKLHGGSE